DKMCRRREVDQGRMNDPPIVERIWDPADTSESDTGGHDVCRRSVTHIPPAADTATGSVSVVSVPSGEASRNSRTKSRVNDSKHPTAGTAQASPDLLGC